jgi:hypothetical protein
MADRIVVRLVSPIMITVQLGGLVTTLLWVFYGYVAGVPALLVSLLLISRAIQTGFVLDREGLHMRPFLPFIGPRVIPWARLRSVEVDIVIDGRQTRSKKPRIRFIADGEQEPLQLIGCRKSKISAVLERFQAQGLPVTDRRALG